MALIIENGTIVADANSFATVKQARDFANLRGATLSSEDESVEQMLIKAGDYLNSLDAEYSGTRVEPLHQTMCYPRRGSTVYGHTLLPTVIPLTLINAQCQLCIELQNNVDLLPTIAGGLDRAIIRDKTGPLETQWSEAVLLSGSIMTVMPAVNGYLDALFGSTGMKLRTVRV